MLENPDFERKYFSRAAIGLFKIGYASIRIKKWLAYYDQSIYENLIYYDLLGSVLKYINEIS